MRASSWERSMHVLTSLKKTSYLHILLKHAMFNLRYLDYGTIVAGMGLGKKKKYSKTRYMQQILGWYILVLLL